MTRKCKNKCGTELPPAAKCDDIINKKGYCTVECLVAHTRKKKATSEKKRKAKEFKEMKDRVESQGNKSKLMQRAQAAFNAYIRERDANQPCISCERLKVNDTFMASAWDAGHYRSRGACPELRFEEDNCFKQCVHCNRDLSGNVANMRIGILSRIGQERLDWIEGPHQPKQYTADDLREITKLYKQKLKELQKDD